MLLKVINLMAQYMKKSLHALFKNGRFFIFKEQDETVSNFVC